MLIVMLGFEICWRREGATLAEEVKERNQQFYFSTLSMLGRANREVASCVC
jgi:hypothetical protein